MLKANEEQMKHITEILGDIYNESVLDYDRETDCGYEEFDDRIYLDGNITFDMMAEIVDYLRVQNNK
jgi:hypothetical protein